MDIQQAMGAISPVWERMRGRAKAETTMMEVRKWPREW
jgi:hypothetical protein